MPGAVLRWRATPNARAGGLIPFLISRGDTGHPVRSAQRELTLEAFHLEHPAPGADVQIRPAAAAALTARPGGPNVTNLLR